MQLRRVLLICGLLTCLSGCGGSGGSDAPPGDEEPTDSAEVNETMIETTDSAAERLEGQTDAVVARAEHPSARLSDEKGNEAAAN